MYSEGTRFRYHRQYHPVKSVRAIKNRPLKYLEDKATTFYYCKSTGIPYRQYSTVVG